MITNEEAEKILNEIYDKTKYKCSSCHGKVRLENNKGIMSIMCCWTPCRQRRTVWKGTIFENSKLEVVMAMSLIHMWLNGIPSKNICTLLNIGRKCFSNFLKKMSIILVNKYYNMNKLQLGGENTIVEIDESKFGRRKYHRWHRVEGLWVLGIVERTPERKIYLIPLENRKATTLTNLICDVVNKSTTIYTDRWKGYNELKNHFNCHLTVNHSKGFVDPITAVHTNTIEGNWSSFKNSIPPRCRTKLLISLYLVRYMILRNKKNYAFYYSIKLLL